MDTTQESAPVSLGGEAISESLYQWIRTHLPEGSTILELGSGHGTGVLSEHYRMISIEDSKKWIGMYDSRYIHAPLKDGWYDAGIIAEALKDLTYDLILIDGPRSPERAPTRQNFLKHIDLFDLNVPVIVDDVHRYAEWGVLLTLESFKGKTAYVDMESDKWYGVIE